MNEQPIGCSCPRSRLAHEFTSAILQPMVVKWKLLNVAKLLAPICGEWWSAMSGAILIPFAFVALVSQGRERILFAVLAVGAVWIYAIRVFRSASDISNLWATGMIRFGRASFDARSPVVSFVHEQLPLGNPVGVAYESSYRQFL